MGRNLARGLLAVVFAPWVVFGCSDQGFTASPPAGSGGSTDGGGTGGSLDGGPCGAGTTACGSDGCVDTNTSAAHCGTCDHACDGLPNAEPACVAGKCALGKCLDGHADCDQDPSNGCETDTANDREHCGSCDASCGTMCASSKCNDPVDISAGFFHTCAVLQDGTVWCWGSNADGQLGDSTVTDKLVPTLVPLPGPALQVAAGGGFASSVLKGSHTCALLADKTVECWGSNTMGQLGTGDTQDSESPKPVALSDVSAIAAGGFHTCATRANKDLYCWGANGFGQVGDGTGADNPTPTKIVSGVVAFDTGLLHTCEASVAGLMTCWGFNGHGQLGDGTIQEEHSPLIGPTLDGAVDVVAGSYFTCALASGGLYCWGDNSSGQLGIGSKAEAHTPQSVPLAGVSLLEAGGLHAGALSGGTLMMWGSDQSGQLGDGGNSDWTSPKSISLANVTKLSLGALHSCALTNGGEMLCWGLNGAGQLGDGSTLDHGVPAPVVWPSQ